MIVMLSEAMHLARNWIIQSNPRDSSVATLPQNDKVATWVTYFGFLQPG